MLTEKGFDDRYYFYCKKSKTYSEAYKKTEKEFFFSVLEKIFPKKTI